MKKLLFILSFTAFLFACSGAKKDKKTEREEIPSDVSKEFVTYSFKVDGLQDSVISDSIWRIIFQVDGIDKLVLSRDDSMAIFTVDPELVENSMLEEEIVRRGGILVK
jgi:hypothetical protein